MNCTERIGILANNEPLSSGDAFEIVEGVQIWRPRWGANINHKVNTLYIAAVTQQVWDNEMVLELTFALQSLTDPASPYKPIRRKTPRWRMETMIAPSSIPLQKATGET